MRIYDEKGGELVKVSGMVSDTENPYPICRTVAYLKEGDRISVYTFHNPGKSQSLLHGQNQSELIARRVR